MREDSGRLAQEEARHASASREVSQDRCFATLPLAAMETALGEVRDVMMQYTRCADPSESAARRERVRQAEAQGQLEESAAQMVRASLAGNEPTEDSPVSPHTHNSAGPQMRLPLSSRLGPPQEIHVASSPRIPVMDRLGPLLDEITTDETAATAENIPQTPKKKLGRPPGKRKVAASPLATGGTTSRSRKTQTVKPPNVRRKATVEPGREYKEGKAPKPRHSRILATQAGTPREEEGASSDNIPLCNMMPPTSRRRMDFRVHSNPAP